MFRHSPVEAAVERFNVRIIGRFTRSGEVQCDVVIIRPSVERLTDELTSVARLDPVHCDHDIAASNRPVDPDGEARQALVIHDS